MHRSSGRGRDGDGGDKSQDGTGPAPGKRSIAQDLVQRRAQPGGGAGSVGADGGTLATTEATMAPSTPGGLGEGYEVAPGPLVQMKSDAGEASPGVHDAAAAGVQGSGAALPFLAVIQPAFGAHDVTGIQAHTGAEATEASRQIGATAYATGNDVAFAGAPDLHTAAHEAAHVVQQRGGVQLAGGVGREGDSYEQHADRVADAVVAGRSAEAILDERAGGGGTSGAVQRNDDKDKKKPEHGAVTDAEIVVTRDKAMATQPRLGMYRDRIEKKMKSWGATFDPATVRLATVTEGTTSIPVIAMTWDLTWGAKPNLPELPPSFGPIDAHVCVKAVSALPGWAKVPAADRDRLQHLLGGETNELSSTARDHLRGTFASIKAQDADHQATALGAIIGNKAAIPSVVDEEVETKPVTVTLTGPVVSKDYAFRGKVADAECWSATFSDGSKLEIVAPKAPEAGLHSHSVAKVADAARYLPAGSRAVIHTVLLNAVVNPEDSHWAAEYNQPDFTSYMTANPEGRVTIYPSKTASLPSDNYMRGTMIHETGHTWSYKTWGTDKTKGRWVDWKNAMDADRVSVSGYAMASIAEDVAETIQVYGSTKGKPKFAEYRAIVPKRFEILDKDLK